jgi:hypothetical protein
VINFTFPNVRPGSVVEFRYTKIEKNIIDIDPWIAQEQDTDSFMLPMLLLPPPFPGSWKKLTVPIPLPTKKELLTKGGPDRE